MTKEEAIEKYIIYKEGKLFWNNLEKTYLNGKEVGSYDKDGYRFFRLKGHILKTHRVVWYIHKKRWPFSEIHHINGVRNDNRVENLHECSAQENLQLKSIKHSSGIRGISKYTRGGWQVYWRNTWVGRFECLGKARKALAKARKWHESSQTG